MQETQQCWSRDQENFNFRELSDLLDSYDELKPGDVVFVAEAVLPEPRRLCDADDVLDLIADRAYDIGGDYAEDCADVGLDGKAELNAFLDAWVKKHCALNFWEVRNQREYELTADDFPQQQAAA